MALGGVVAAGLIALAVVTVTIVGIVLAGATGVLLYGAIAVAWLIVRAIRTQRPDTYIAPSNQSTAEALTRRSRRADETGGLVWALVTGLVLTVVADLVLGQLGLSLTAEMLLPPAIGALLGLGGYSLLRRWMMGPDSDAWPPSREIRARIGRIRRKASSLSKEASEAGGVFSDLDRQADELSRRAGDLADRIYELRQVARETRGDLEQAGVPPGPADPSQQRLHELLMRNQRSQHNCVAQLQRIEKLLDVARLEISCPDGRADEHDPAEVARDFERELEAIRQALDEVHQQVQ